MQCSEEDRHVLAAACHSPAETLVTFNVADFPSAATEPVGIEVNIRMIFCWMCLIWIQGRLVIFVYRH